MVTAGHVCETGSFRDPSGSVLYVDGEVYRGIDEDAFAVVKSLEDEGLLDKLADDGLLIRTSCVVFGSELERKLHKAFPGFARFLSHETVPFISYPYEWTVSMLADAGLLHLDLQLRLLEHGYSLKDATAFNVAFVGSRPVFMDVPSIEVPKRKDVWVAYGQFCRMFVFPLLLQRIRGMDLKMLFASDLSGPSVSATRRMLGFLNSFRPVSFLDVFLQNILHAVAGKGGTRGEASNQRFNAKVSDDTRAQSINLQRLKAKLKKLARPRAGLSDWAAYEQTHRYDEAGESEKTAFVKECLEEAQPRYVCDIGCNTGRFSMLAVEAGCRCVAADLDHDCVDILYRRVAGKNIDLLPLCLDIANPSPALGFRHRERKSFEDRADFDCVIGLALIHHLLVASRIPLSALVDLFSALTSEWLIIEFVHTDDIMFKQLLVTRENLYGDLTDESFENAFSSQFTIVRKKRVLEGQRVLYLMKRVRAI